MHSHPSLPEGGITQWNYPAPDLGGNTTDLQTLQLFHCLLGNTRDTTDTWSMHVVFFLDITWPWLVPGVFFCVKNFGILHDSNWPKNWTHHAQSERIDDKLSTGIGYWLLEICPVPSLSHHTNFFLFLRQASGCMNRMIKIEINHRKSRWTTSKIIGFN